MKAIRIIRPKTKPILSIVDKPLVKSNQILVKLEFSPINPHDIGSIMGYQKMYQGFPLTLGVEGIGIVHDVGGDVDSSLIGKRVSCISNTGS